MIFKSSHKKIEKKITDMPEGSVFVTSDFSDIAVVDTVSKVLTRLSDNKLVQRVTRGVYWRPWKNSHKEQHPDPNNVAQAIARNNCQRVIPCGDTALCMLGLKEEAPKEWTYITDGAYRKYSYRNIKICFKHATGKMFNTMSDKTALVVQVLKAYGKEYLTVECLQKIASKLTKEECMKLLAETKHTTAWIFKAVCQMSEEFVTGKKHHDSLILPMVTED